MVDASYWGPQTIIYSTNGDPARNVLMEVRESGSNALTTLYADAARSTPISNPTRTDQYGNLAFYIDAGTYFVSVVGSDHNFRIVVPSLGGGTGGYTPHEHVESTPKAVWTVPHNRGYRPPAVSVFSLDYAIEYDEFTVQHVNANQLLISMDVPVAGRALM